MVIDISNVRIESRTSDQGGVCLHEGPKGKLRRMDASKRTTETNRVGSEKKLCHRVA
jgi:hypothetical protein